MDNKEKQILVTMLSMIFIMVTYSLYVYNHYIRVNPGLVDDFRFWGQTFLVLIPVTIISQIVIHIVFAIINKIMTNEDLSTISDERDRLIELKALRVSHWIFTGGFLLAMVLLAVGIAPYMMLLTLMVSGFVAAIISEMVRIYYYRKGF